MQRWIEWNGKQAMPVWQFFFENSKLHFFRCRKVTRGCFCWYWPQSVRFMYRWWVRNDFRIIHWPRWWRAQYSPFIIYHFRRSLYAMSIASIMHVCQRWSMREFEISQQIYTQSQLIFLIADMHAKVTRVYIKISRNFYQFWTNSNLALLKSSPRCNTKIWLLWISSTSQRCTCK